VKYKLTDVKVKNERAREKKFRLADGGGLYLQVEPTGAKLWRWKYRFGGREKVMAFGQYPKVSLSEARQKHEEASKILGSGVDPMAERKKEKQQERAGRGDSFESVAKKHFAQWSEGTETKYAARIKEALERDVYPHIRHRPIAEIEAPEIVRLVRAIEDRGAEDTARRMYGKISEAFRWAIAHGACTRNPAMDVKPGDFLKPQVVVNFARVEEMELPTLLRKIEIYQGAQRVRIGLKLLAHTFVRTHELIKARWSEIDFEKGEWRIPGERMKSTKSRKKFLPPHIVPLTRQTMELFWQLHSLTGDGNGELMFPGEWDKKKHLSNNTFLQALYRMGYKGEMTGHGFRGVASTILHEYRSEHGFTHEHIELQLAHIKQNDESAAYDYSKSLRERREMMQWWSDFLEKAQRAEVIAMPHAS
jgi:integrase